ncbi:MAG TPA: hypothetical protein VN784_12340 [Candidatus Limnocylindrales bacterium]|nr:hypothetical protein [Candidatus Limnocylindrales bacterium]
MPGTIQKRQTHEKFTKFRCQNPGRPLPPTGSWSDRTEAVIYPVSSSLDLHAEANTGAGQVQDDNAMGQTTGLNALSASVLALLQNVSARELFWKKNIVLFVLPDISIIKPL